MVQMREDNIFQQKMLFSNLLFANGVVTCVIVMKCEWELLSVFETRIATQMINQMIECYQCSSHFAVTQKR